MSDAPDIASDLLAIFQNTNFITVATVCEDGSPWATPLGWFAAVDDEIVFDNRVGTVHADNLARDNRCFITIVNEDLPKSRSAHIKTVARKLTGAEYDRARELILARGLDVTDDIFAVKIGKLVEEKTRRRHYYFE
jgi:hypothetical protein